jgi:autophagy-related protein 13
VKPLSPHTPHTPAIPSRLSENSIIDYPGGHRQGAHRLATTADTVSEADVDAEGGDGEETQVPVSQEGTTAIDIPLSPRLLQTVGSTNRRASSVAHQKRSTTVAPQVPDDDDVDVLGQRSISLGAEDREAPTLSTLLGKRSPKRDKGGDNPSSSGAGHSRGKQLSSDLGPSSSSTGRSQGKIRDQIEPKGESPGSHLLSGSYRARYSTRGSGAIRPSSSRGSFSGGTGPRYGDGVDDEPLVFAMSELERDSRRSLEEQQGRGSTSAASSLRSTRDREGERDRDRDHPGFEPRGTSRRGW